MAVQLALIEHVRRSPRRMAKPSPISALSLVAVSV
jgi:hypothetical protein